MTILRSGSSKEYSDGWASAFGRTKAAGKKAKATKPGKTMKKVKAKMKK